MYGGDLNLGALSLIKKAPFFLLIFSYWMLGNRQIFFNESKERTNQTDPADPQHYLFQYEDGANYTVIFLIFIPIFFFFEYILIGIRFIFYKIGCWKQMKGTDLSWNLLFAVNEHLGSYWKSLRGQNQLRWFFKELY